MRIKVLWGFLAAFLLCASSVYGASANELTSIRWSVQPEGADGSRSTRIVADLRAAVSLPTARYDEKNLTLTIDVKGALPGKNTGNLPIKTDKIRRVSLQKISDGSRLVIYLTGPLDRKGYNIFILKIDPETKRPDRVVIDIYEKMPGQAPQPSIKGKIILIDPGHGGGDPGAIGPAGLKEKDVNLQIALKLRDALTKRGARITMTRTRDVDVHSRNATAKEELQARVDVGQRAKADIFISVHANASTNNSQGGLSTYYYAKTRSDALLAAAIQNSLTTGFALNDKGVRQADFYVIKRSTMPAVLLEIGFISNPSEEKLLRSNWFQNKVVACIEDGLENYFRQIGGGG